ncbi:hypothetical protein SAMN05443245_2607 [Paraburkholderia fungorum]|uniref:Copper resistance protein CopC n=1 Tax=Paraburkholderia fungorum TaxID=134537 RepID=A0A1H1DEZ0_9BURK|nr:hypothetical protein [Paraburkholderia fungorum]SDQ74809.1 hypothetical protein SAMN05443245_2607 [Paraburkholderia fungorum]
MRFVFRIDLHNIVPCAALFAALALSTLSGGVHGQEATQAGTAMLAESADPASHAHFIFTSMQSAALASASTGADALAEGSPLASYALTMPVDGASMNDISLDDQMLSRQRGGALGMVMVAATPQLMRGNGSVTLWDEIAPPSPMPIPVDAARNAQGNVATYQRK